MSVTAYILDENRVYTGNTEEIDERDPTTKDKTRVAPPSIPDGKVAVYKGGKNWVILDDYPTPRALLRVPTVVSMRQARLALLSAGLLDQVEPAISALESPTKEAAQIEWEYATTVERNSEIVGVLQVELGLTDQQVNDLFEDASTR